MKHDSDASTIEVPVPDLEDRPTAELVSAERTLLSELNGLFLDEETLDGLAHARAIAETFVSIAKVLGMRHRYGVGLDVVTFLASMDDGGPLTAEVRRGAAELVAARLARAV